MILRSRFYIPTRRPKRSWSGGQTRSCGLHGPGQAVSTTHRISVNIVLLKLLTNRRCFSEERLERAWVIRVAVNCCKDWKKSAWFRKRVSLDAAADAAVYLPEPEDTPVLRAVQSLPERYRQAVYLRYYEEYEPAEIAELMGCKATQVSTYLYRGKAKLRTMLGGIYGEECLSK